jgi:AbrB family looped-hinge helix DNA binding protein
MVNKNDIILIVKIRSRDRIIFPKQVREALDVKDGSHIAFLRDGNPGIRVQKVSFENFEDEKNKA